MPRDEVDTCRLDNPKVFARGANDAQGVALLPNNRRLHMMGWRKAEELGLASSPAECHRCPYGKSCDWCRD